MKGSLQPKFLPTVLFLLTVGLCATTTAQEAFHQFANKDGQKIEAKIVSVTSDLKTMKIQRRDGQGFDMAINVLSLDDQQIVKEWIKANPNGAKIDFNLDVEIEKKAKTVKNERDSYYKYKTMDVTYEVVIKNRTRQDLTGARANYVVIMENSVKIGRTLRGLPDYFSGSDDDDGETQFLRKSETLKSPLPFNHDHTFLTEAVQHEQIFGDGNVSYGEDKVLGMILQVVGPNDEVLGEYRSSESHVQKVTWDQVKGRGFASDDATPRPVGAAPAPDSPELPDWLEVSELDSWPEVLQKGDTIGSSDMPKWGQKPVRISATVDIDEENSGGTIVACGGQSKGFALFVLNDALHFWTKKAFENNQSRKESLEVPLSKVPAGEFKVNAEYTDSSMKLWIDDTLVAEGPSVGLVLFRPQEGLSVGYDSDETAVGPASPPHAFRGGVRDVRVQFGN